LDVETRARGEGGARQGFVDAAGVERGGGAAKRVQQSGVVTGMRPMARGRMVQAIGRWLMERQEELARSLTLEQGKPLWEARGEIAGAANYFEYYGGQAATVEGRSVPLGAGYFDWTENEPYGVSGQIIPWNFPLEMVARSLSAALTTGNASVIKTPELTPLTCAIAARAAEEVGFPPGAVNILCGLGPVAGAALSGHRDVNQVVFTGSVPTGIAIATAAAANVVPCVLELGGKSAAIVHEDADLDAFENSLRMGIFFNSGQVCSAMSRVVVHESRHNELVERASAIAKGLSVGPGIERDAFGANMGSMVSLKQRDRASGMVSAAQDQGARVAAGGRPLNRPGAFHEPTVLEGVTPDMTIAQEEVFGPVVSVLPFRDDAQAVEIANGVDYGLVAGVFTRDLDRATQAARRLRAGQIFVNEWFAGGVETPFGGYGRSGYGREKGREALWNYVQTKNVAVRLG